MAEPQLWTWLRLFLVPKKDRRMRPVIKLKALNQFVKTQQGMQTVRDLLRPNKKDLYFTIPIHPDHQQFLRFAVEEQSFCLPFGLSSALWIFYQDPKASCSPAQRARDETSRLYRRLPGDGRDHGELTTLLVSLLKNLGFLLSEKSVYHSFEAKGAGRKDKKDQAGSQKPPEPNRCQRGRCHEWWEE